MTDNQAFDRALGDQWYSEILEAEGQIRQAKDLMQMGGLPYGGPGLGPRELWLCYHKLREAIRNLEDVADGLHP